MLAAGEKPKETKINLMDCICMCSEVEIDREQCSQSASIIRGRTLLVDLH